MINIYRTLNNDRVLSALIGYDRTTFDTLLATFSTVWQKELSSKIRQRALGGGQAGKARLSRMEEKLFYILFYCKWHPTFHVAGLTFGFDRSQAYRWVRRLQPILEASIDSKIILPIDKLGSIKQFLDYCPEAKAVILDNQELPILHPQQVEPQTSSYLTIEMSYYNCSMKHLGQNDGSSATIVQVSFD